MSHAEAQPGLAGDIQHNRGGRLSAAQRTVLDRAASVRRADFGCWLVASCCGLIIVIYPWVLIRGDRIRTVADDGTTAFVTTLIFLIGGLYCAARAVRLARRRAVLRADLAGGRVATFQAHAVWRNRKFSGDYVLEPANGSAPVHAGYAPLPPGPYRAYALPRSRVVVAVESTVVRGGVWSVSLTDAEQVAFHFFGSSSAPVVQPFPIAPYVGDRAELLRGLAAALDFDAEDLGHNRRGAMSPRQVRRCLTSTAGIPLLFAFFGEMWVAFGYLAHNLDGWMFAVPVLVTLVGHLVMTRDVFVRRVEILDGVVDRRFTASYGGDSTTHYYFQVDGQRFTVRERACRALVPQLRYRLYLASRSRRLLSVDPLDSSSDPLLFTLRSECIW